MSNEQEGTGVSFSEIVGPDGEVLDETKSVKVGLDRAELMAEFALLAEEEREEEERAQAVFAEAVENLKLYAQLDLETISNLLTVLEDSGRDEGTAWEFFFQQGGHQILLVLLNEAEVVEDQRRTDQILQMWERIARFVFKLSTEDQHVVYNELRRQGMVETLALAMRHHPQHPPVLRRASFLLAQLFAHDCHPSINSANTNNPSEQQQQQQQQQKEEEEDLSVHRRMAAAEGLLALFQDMESQSSTYSPDLLDKVRAMREAVSGGGKVADKEPAHSSTSTTPAIREGERREEQEEGSGGQAQRQRRRAEEAEAKRAEEVERSRKQDEERPQAGAPTGRVRPIHDVVDMTPSFPSSEKAPLLSAHQRHAGFNQVVSGDGCCSACVLM